MKKYIIFVLTIILALSLCACRRNNAATTPNTSNVVPSTDMNVLPDTMPTLETNIPDPNVDTQMPGYTDGTDITDDIMDDFTKDSTK